MQDKEAPTLGSPPSWATHLLNHDDELYWAENLDYMCRSLRVRDLVEGRIGNPGSFKVVLEYNALKENSTKSAWSGDGMPPEGFECEVKSGKGSWTLCRVVHSSQAGVAFIYLEEPSPEISSSYIGVLDSVPRKHAGDYFRPVRTEAERKRDETIDRFVQFYIDYHSYPKGAEQYLGVATSLYDAIASGKIAGVKLESS